MNKDIDIIGIGVSTLDIISVVDHFPPGEEVQKSIASAITGGGPIATALAAASKLGSKTIMLDSLGNDWIGVDIKEELSSSGVDTSFIKINQNFSSSFAQVLVRKNDGARTIVYTPGNSPDFPETGIREELISRAKYVHMNGRHFSACLKACEIAKSCNTKISFDGGAHRYKEKFKQIIPNVDLVIASRQFAFEYSKESSNENAANLFLESGVDTVVITDGTKGSWLFNGTLFNYHQPAFINENVFDTTGCGDSYHGAFLFSLCNEKNYKEAMMIASAVASINASSLGGRKGLPALSELKSFLNNHSFNL